MTFSSAIRGAVVLYVALASLSVAAFAEEEKAKKEPGSGPNPFADCGIGAALFSETKWAAVTSNVIWDLGITALTSATASPETCSGKKVAAAMFIHQTYDRLAEETAAGRGQHLTAVLNILQCQDARHGDAIQQIRGEMARSVGNAQYAGQTRLERASALYAIVSEAVTTRCAV